MSLDLAPGIYHGALIEVIEAEGTGLVGDHTAGATVLNVSSGGFRTAGQCRVLGNVYAYTREDDALTLTPALLVDAEDGTPVESLTPEGEVETRKLAVVDLDMLGEDDDSGEEDPNLPRAEIPGELSGFYPIGDAAAGAMVDLEDTTYGYRVKGRPHDAPSLDGAAIDTTTLPPMPGGQTISDDAPVDTTGYPEDYGWWQVDADGKVLGFWRLVAGVWTPQTVVTAEALQAGNILADAIDATDLSAVTITGALIRTAASGPRWELLTADGNVLAGYSSDANEVEAAKVFARNPTTGYRPGLAALVLQAPRTTGVLSGDQAMLTLLANPPGGLSQAQMSADWVRIFADEVTFEGGAVVDATMRSGSVGTGTFRDSVDARAAAVSAARMQAGTVNSGTLVAATNKTVSVTFPTAFDSAPKVVVSPKLGAEAAATRRCSVVDGSETTTGFQINFWRDTGTIAFDANWLAVKP